MTTRRAFLLTPLAIAACARTPKPPRSSGARRLAITMDDPVVDETPRLDSRARDAALLQALATRRIRAALFVCGKRVDSAEGAALLARWSSAGHILGNHSYSHRFFHSRSMTLADSVEELEKGEAIVRPYPGFRRRFRFPFLKEGNTIEKRDGARAALARRTSRTCSIALATTTA